MTVDTKLFAPTPPAGLPIVGQYKLDYFVKKYDLTTIRARSILAKAGTSRDKANAAAILATSK